MNKKFNNNEKEFLELLRAKEADISSEYSMEIQHCYDEDDPDLDGWYVYKYSESRGESIPVDIFAGPILSDKEAKEKNIDVVKCLDEYKCFYVP